MNLKEKIIAESKKLGIDKIGFTSAAPFSELEASLREQKDRGFTSGFEHSNIEERIYPEKTFEGPQTIISIALAYPTKMKEKVPRDEKRGQFARASWGIDYHTILKERLEKLIAFIQQQACTLEEKEHWRFAPQVDTGELVDVAVAQRAGLGFIGKNGLLITKEFGSFVYLGEIITNIAFEIDQPVADGCGECRRCVNACPTTALLGDGRMNAQRCLSFQTQTKGFVPEEYRKKMGNVLYGCDICQLVCPYNKGVDNHFHQEMEPELATVYPKLKPILSMSNQEFKATFGHLSGAWRGKKPIQRNALIALANLGDRSALPAILTATKDVRPVIRGTAIWAIGKLGNREPEKWLAILNELLDLETDSDVIHELKQAMERLGTNVSGI